MEKIITTDQLSKLIHYIEKNVPILRPIAQNTFMAETKEGAPLGSIWYEPLTPPMIKVRLLGAELKTLLKWGETLAGWGNLTLQQILVPHAILPAVIKKKPVIPPAPKKIYTRDIPGTLSLK